MTMCKIKGTFLTLPRNCLYFISHIIKTNLFLIMKKSTLLLVSLLSIAGSAFAQSNFYKWGVGVHPSAYSFTAPDSNFFNPKSYTGGVQFSIFRRLNSSFDGGLEFGLGTVQHPDNYNAFMNRTRTPFWRGDYYETNLALKYKFDNGYILKKESWFAPFLKGGVGMNWHEVTLREGTDTISSWRTNGYAPLGAGINFRLNKIAADIVIQSVYNFGIDAPSFIRHSIGLNLNFAKRNVVDLPLNKSKDRDQDGIADQVDACPDVFGLAVAKGCPDSDGDGITDAEDRCPTTPGYANLIGCVDSDYDGIVDPDDECPNVYGEELNGCPTPKPADSDGDGIADDRDACPYVKGYFTAKGCPDRDGDGIQDANDSCPDEYGSPEHKGCPAPAKVITRPAVTTATATSTTTSTNYYTDDICAKAASEKLGPVYFTVNNPTPTAESMEKLERAIEIMNRCSDVNMVITGHTDSDASDSYNQTLSQKRAESVRQYLIKKGLAGNRLKTKGMGESQPISPNTSESGKAKNRRVEFEFERN